MSRSCRNDRIGRPSEFWFDMPPVGGTAMDTKGNIYFSDLARNALVRLTPDRHTETVISDPRLHWVDAPFIDGAGWIWLPVPQMDRVTVLNRGVVKTKVAGAAVQAQAGSMSSRRRLS